MSHLGKTTSSELGLLKVGVNIMVTTKANKLKQQYPDVLEGVGKFENKLELELELELYFYLNTVNLSDKITIKIITIYFNLYKHDLKI